MDTRVVAADDFARSRHADRQQNSPRSSFGILKAVTVRLVSTVVRTTAADAAGLL